MEKEARAVDVRLKPEAFVTVCRCIKDDFEAWYQACLEDPFADNSANLDRMEEDLEAMKALLPAVSSETTDIEIRKILAEFADKIAEVC